MSPLTRAALEYLRERCTFIYLRSFVSPEEKKWAVDVLRALHCEAGEDLDPGQIESWAANAGWNAEDARRLREIAEGVRRGRKFYAANRIIRCDAERARVMVDSWREVLTSRAAPDQ